MKMVLFPLAALLVASQLAGCSNIVTYVRHEETKGNVQCSNDKALKRDSTCNASTTDASH